MTIQWSHYKTYGRRCWRNSDLRIGRKRCGLKKKAISCKHFTKQQNDDFLSDEIHCFSAKFMMNICCGIWQVLSRYCGEQQQHSSPYKSLWSCFILPLQYWGYSHTKFQISPHKYSFYRRTVELIQATQRKSHFSRMGQLPKQQMWGALVHLSVAALWHKCALVWRIPNVHL